MKKQLWFICSLACFLAFGLVSCKFDVGNLNIAGNNSGKSVNVDPYADAFQEVDFLADAQPLVFGPSSSATYSSVTLGGNMGVPDGSIELRAVNGAGKIAGSEDGIAFYYKEVDASKNFIMEADFTIKTFGNGASSDPNIAGTPEDKGLSSNGQEGWGIMARDFIPQWKNYTMVDIRDKQLPLNTQNSSQYFPGARGGDSNMILVGGVKRGARVYWREGIQWDKATPLLRWNDETQTYEFNMESGDPTENAYMDAGNCRFDYIPAELGDYSMYTSLDGTPTLAARPDFPAWGSTYTIRLEKTNNGFNYMIHLKDSPDGKQVPDYTTYGKDGNPKIPLYDITNSINKEKYYVGLFAARDARVWVSNIKYWEADTDACEPYVAQTPDQVTPTLEVVSPEFYTGNDYLYVKSNVSGALDVVQDGTRIPSSVIFREWIVEKDNGVGLPLTLWTVPTLPQKNGENVFTLTFYPDKNLPPELKNSGASGKVIKSTTPIKRTFIVTKKLYNNGTGDIWVSPDGRTANNGSSGSPLDLQTAINYCQPGQTIKMKDGVYTMSKFLTIPRYNDGRFGAEKILMAEDRNKVFIDFNKNPLLQESNQGLMAGGSYWILDGFHVRNTPDKTKGVVVSGYNNTLRWLMIYNNGDTGMQLSGSASEPKRFWPSGNTIEYCESFNNMDAAQTDADGFAAKLTVGNDNKFLWCISHNNNDDGWDCFTKKESGSIGIVRFFGNASYNNVWLLDGHRSNRGAGNGFKLGGEGIAIHHEVRDCIAFATGGSPFTSNSNPSADHYYCTAINTDGKSLGSISINSGDSSTPNGKREHCVSTNNPGTSVLNIAGGYSSLLYSLNDLYTLSGITAVSPDGTVYDISNVKQFMKRKPDGRPDFGDIYKPAGVEGADGAWAFYVADKPEPDFIN